MGLSRSRSRSTTASRRRQSALSEGKSRRPQRRPRYKVKLRRRSKQSTRGQRQIVKPKPDARSDSRSQREYVVSKAREDIVTRSRGQGQGQVDTAGRTAPIPLRIQPQASCQCCRSQNATSPKSRYSKNDREPTPGTSAATRYRVRSSESRAALRCLSQYIDRNERGKKSKRRRRGRILPPNFRARSRQRHMTREVTERIAKELNNRIRSLPMNDRPMPNTTDLSVLGHELKVRLGARAPTLVETGRRGGLVTVTELKDHSRLVPVLDINPEQDSEIHCYIRVKRVEANKRRGRGVR